MGRQPLNRARKSILFNMDIGDYEFCFRAMAQEGLSISEYFRKAGIYYGRILLREEADIKPQTAERKPLSLALDPPAVEDPPIITTLVPKEEAIAVVDTSPRPYDPTKDDVMDYIKGKRS